MNIVIFRIICISSLADADGDSDELLLQLGLILGDMLELGLREADTEALVLVLTLGLSEALML
jgi:hypothetical protein